MWGSWWHHIPKVHMRELSIFVTCCDMLWLVVTLCSFFRPKKKGKKGITKAEVPPCLTTLGLAGRVSWPAKSSCVKRPRDTTATVTTRAESHDPRAMAVAGDRNGRGGGLYSWPLQSHRFGREKLGNVRPSMDNWTKGKIWTSRSWQRMTSLTNCHRSFSSVFIVDICQHQHQHRDHQKSFRDVVIIISSSIIMAVFVTEMVCWATSYFWHPLSVTFSLEGARKNFTS